MLCPIETRSFSFSDSFNPASEPLIKLKSSNLSRPLVPKAHLHLFTREKAVFELTNLDKHLNLKEFDVNCSISLF